MFFPYWLCKACKQCGGYRNRVLKNLKVKETLFGHDSPFCNCCTDVCCKGGYPPFGRIYLSKSPTERREEKLAKKLRALAVSNPTQLKITWGRLLNCWILEAIRRGRALQKEPDLVRVKETAIRKEAFLGGKKLDPNPLDPERDVYGIQEKAVRMFKLCGPEVEREVGAETREMLNHNCAKAVALAFDSNMYKLNIKLCKLKPKQRAKASRATPTSTQGD